MEEVGPLRLKGDLENLALSVFPAYDLQDVELMLGNYRGEVLLIIAAIFFLMDEKGKGGTPAIVNSRRNGTSRC